MQVREDNYNLVAYVFDRNELKVIQAAFENVLVRGYIKTQRADMVVRHLLENLETIQGVPQSAELTFALNEAYLKGALDFAHRLLLEIRIPAEPGES